MPEKRAWGESSGRSSSGLASLWQRAARQLRHLSGRRDAGEDRWTWFGEEPYPRHRRRRLFLILAEAGAGIALIAVGALFVVLRTGDADSPSAIGTATPSATPLIAPSPSASPIGFTVTPRLAIWDSPHGLWETDDLTVNRSGDGQTVPFLLLIENAAAGQTYNVHLTYQCRADDVAGLEFLTDFDRDTGSGPALAAPGPQRSFPDTAFVVPDDPSIAEDDEPNTGSFRLWGGTVEGAPSGPAPAFACETTKTFSIRVRALGDTVHLLWGVSLAATVGADGARLEMKAVIEGAQQQPAAIGVVVSG